LAGCTLSLAVAAQEPATPAEGQHADHEQHAQAESAAPNGEHAMAGMHEHMLTMRGQMARIRAAEDPAERQRLLEEHMQSMERHMQMMDRMPRQPGGERVATRCAEGDMGCRMLQMQAQTASMRQSMRMMQDRMDSMQALMRQMLDHLHEGEAQHPGERSESD
jgi:hypothetical protein